MTLNAALQERKKNIKYRLDTFDSGRFELQRWKQRL